MKRELSPQAQVAKMIRSEMKRRGIIGTVRSSSFAGGNDVTVDVTDLPPNVVGPFKDYCDQFQRGHFDGMTDMYEYSNRRSDIPQAKYVFVNNRLSQLLRNAIEVQQAGYWGDWNDVTAYERDRRVYVAFTRADSSFWNPPDEAESITDADYPPVPGEAA